MKTIFPSTDFGSSQITVSYKNSKKYPYFRQAIKALPNKYDKMWSNINKKNVSFDLHLIYAFNISWHLWTFPVKKMGVHFKKMFKRL